ncbi:Bacterial Ig-like domain (group 2) [Symmachiella dynata]|uniref:Bacterial Ig-like domain (Group 2) n=1 Tax=Symmachiella dynata TaxID=2527995 RepID=A0A517ZRZ5_9PLAN|nr:Bacterial Ig-like domain (group 2) [Symmachiella dynata]
MANGRRRRTDFVQQPQKLPRSDTGPPWQSPDFPWRKAAKHLRYILMNIDVFLPLSGKWLTLGAFNLPVEHPLCPRETNIVRGIVFLLSGIALAAVPGNLHADHSSETLETLSHLAVAPQQVVLEGPRARTVLIVDGTTANGQKIDVTRDAQFAVLDTSVANIAPNGVVRGIADGKTEVVVTVAEKTIHVPVTIYASQAPQQFHFENDIVPLLTRYGCNTSGCHGKAEGQNGFKLSVFGFQPDDDYAALTKENRGRRVSTTMPETSLMLTKASGGVPHGGGIRLRKGSGDYRTLRNWIDAGTPFGNDDAATVAKITVSPSERQLTMQAQQQLRVVATYTDGREVDVTAHAQFQSNNDALGKVDEFGLVTAGDSPGDVAVMASYMGAVDVFRSLIPRTETIADYPAVTESNFIDPLIHDKLRKLNILPAGPADDATYLRRVYLDVIGTLPTPAESRAFLSDSRPNRRALLVDKLLARPEYADYQALKWSDLLRVNRLALGHKGAYAYYRWIRDTFRDNKPMDAFAAELVTAAGPTSEAPAAHFYKVAGDAHKRAATFSQVFLGVRIECAQCHHHPQDRWSQTDYYGMHAFFTQPTFQASNLGELLTTSGQEKSVHPRTNQEIFAYPLATPYPKHTPTGDRRERLADWLTDAENPWFARNIVNRAWAHFLGRGLVEPIDDFRLTNPPSNPQLLDALAREFVENGYDYQHLIRTITASAAYQRASTVNETNRRDEQNYSRFLFKRIDAEVLLDAVVQVTGVPEKFAGVAAGYRAIQLWDSQVPHYFLKTFGRPVRATACSCERTAAPTVGQVLHVLNSPEIQEKLSHQGGRIAGMLRSGTDDETFINELSLACFSRPPTEAEQAKLMEHLQGKQGPARQQAAEDIAWSMLNSMEFLFNH